MIKVKTKTEYWAKKQALWEAIRHFQKNTFDKNVKITCIPEESNQYTIIFSKEKLIKEISFDFTKDNKSLIEETKPADKRKDKKEGVLYHKKNILRIYNNSLI